MIGNTASSTPATTGSSKVRLSRRTIGKLMIGIGVAGVVVGTTAVVVGQSMIGQVETSVDDSLRLTGEALSSVTDSIAVTNSIVSTVRSGMTSIRTTMTTIETSLDETSTALTEGGEFIGGSLPEALDAVNGILPTIESIANSVDDTLELLDGVPFGPNYAPVQPFDQAIGDLTTALEPLPEQLRSLGTNFDGLTDSASTMSDDVAQLGQDLLALDTQLGSVAGLLDRYAETAAEAEILAASSRDDLSRSADVSRWMLVLLGVVFALGQIVPIWLGTVLMGDGVQRTIITRRSDASHDDRDGSTAPRRSRADRADGASHMSADGPGRRPV